MKTKSFGIILGIVALIGAVAVVVIMNNARTKNATGGSQTSNVKVATSFYPLYYFTKEIGRENVDVTNLTPAGAEPHDYEPNTGDIARIEKSDLLIVNGAGFEPWLDKLVSDLKEKKVGILQAAEGLATRPQDPHVWLDPVLAKQEVARITAALIQRDPTHADSYQANGTQLEERLDVLHAEFQQTLGSCKLKTTIESHEAFGYLVARYGIEQLALTGMSPDQEPSPQALAQLTRLAKEKGITHIFFETLVSPRLAETLAREVGARTLIFDPIEGLTEEDQKGGKDYFSVQRENLTNLAQVLGCQ